jgi:hypothetical protein
MIVTGNKTLHVSKQQSASLKQSFMGKKKLEARRVIIKDPGKHNDDYLRLYGIYKSTIDTGLSFEKFDQLYYSDSLVYIDFTLHSFQGQTAGFSAAFFYSAAINGRASFIARSATGLKKEFQGQGLFNRYDLYFKFIRFAALHPFSPLWVAAFIINAFIYGDLCRFVPSIFPNPHKSVPPEIEKLMDGILENGHHERETSHPYSVNVPIQVTFNNKLLERIYSSKDHYVLWYLQQNPKFLEKYGLLVMINVSVKNIFGTLLNFIKHFFAQKTAAG